MKIKAVIFDLDDTLLQTRKTKYAALKHEAKLFYNFSLTDDDITKHWGKPFETFMRDLFQNRYPYEDLRTHYFSIRHLFPNKAYPDALTTVQTLLAHLHVGILSSAAKHLVINDLKDLGFDYRQLFYVQGSEDTTVHKPHPGVFAPILLKLKQRSVAPSSDYLAARHAGLEFYGIPERTTPVEVFDQAGAKTLATISDLLTLLPKYE